MLQNIKMVGEIMRKKYIYLLLAVMLFMGCGQTVVMGTGIKDGKTNEAAIVSTSTVEDSIFLFVKSPAGKMEQVTYQLGVNLCDHIKPSAISQLDVAMKTLVLVDNSFSISKDDRQKTKDMLVEFIAEKKDNELVRIATFDKEIHYLTDYISDYIELKKTIQSITYKDQETYLTDVLYEVLKNDFATPEEVYNRIIIISDGVDNKALGYTKEELYIKVKEKAIPIYTIGCSNGKNEETLKNMFALSRTSNVKYYLMDEVKDLELLVQEIAQDRTITRLEVIPEADLLDGSIKNSKLTFEDSGEVYSLTADVLMPFKVKEAEQVTPTPTLISEVVETPQDETSKVETANKMQFYLICIAIGVVVVGGIGFMIMIFLKKKKQQNSFETISSHVVANYEEDEIQEPTEMAGNDGEEGTCRIWDEPKRKTLILTDIKSPSKTFQVPIAHSVIVGRSSKNSTLVIDYDKSVSGKHCEIEMRGDNKLFIMDLESSNGTYVNGNRVLTETEISSGVIIKLGRLEFKLEVR
ncbi:FHA domain-containing protein [Cellulosilyticum sp. ST5]|nr:FHA domain-containing protein [Cellulosilyticum sp. WCF-2]